MRVWMYNVMMCKIEEYNRFKGLFLISDHERIFTNNILTNNSQPSSF